ncbi:MAG TPA: ankyrin repeat domain-containing protein [Bryobacteraceae bacterium]|nr:ankyrin repeat domain-containing protein [Bryobacteraceae bacterium]
MRILILVCVATLRCLGQVKEEDIRPAAARSVVALQTAATKWFEKQTCASCHHQGLPTMVFDAARRRGVAIDETVIPRIMDKSFGFLRDLDAMVQGSIAIDPQTFGQQLLASEPLGLRPNTSTAVYARFIARRQSADGHWTNFDQRPPQQFSKFTTTAVGLQTLQLFLPRQMERERRERVMRAATWLKTNTPRNVEDRVYQMYGLSWAGDDAESLTAERDALLSEQAADGGWGQLEGMKSDAYSTGQALAVLNQAAGVHVVSAQWQKGLRYLLSTQDQDGVWFVASRLHPPAPLSPPYFESGFPYGHDQTSSAMGTSWASLALLLALPLRGQEPAAFTFPELLPTGVQPWAETVLFGDLADLQALIDGGWDPNSATKGGTTALMMAAPDPEKCALLLKRGAAVNAKTKNRYTALMIAANHAAFQSVRMLLDRGAEIEPAPGQPAQYGVTAFDFAVWSGDIESMEALRRRGAKIDGSMLFNGLFPVTPLSIAVFQDNVPMVRALIQAGAPVNRPQPDETVGVTPLGWAVFKNDTETAALLITAGADINHVDKFGYTPLHWAANVDYGDTAMLELLLKAGAKPTLRTPAGLTAADLAVKFKHSKHLAVLEHAAR